MGEMGPDETAMSRRASDVHLWAEPWKGDDQTIEMFSERMSAPGAPHHLAKYNRGVYEFSVDVLDDPELTRGLAGATAERRPAYRATEQQLAFMMTALDRQLDAADTGRLIRMVLHAENGALYVLAVTPQNYVLGIMFDEAAGGRGEPSRSLPRAPRVRDCDIFISRLASALRDRLGLPPQNPGGWHTRVPELEDQTRDELTAGWKHLSAVSRWGAETVLADRMAAFLNPAELIYLARCRDGKVVGEADLFRHSEVAAARPPGETPERARRYYRGLAQDCGLYARQLGQIACQAVRGRLLRIVLDVEQGAIYHYRLNPAEYLVGVTLNQKRVSQADERIADLVTELLGE
jgi:hypothetical protein